MFMLDDIAIDKIISGVALNSKGDAILYRLSQLADATIELTSEKKDITDKDGTIIRSFYRAKQGTLNANNAMLNLSILGAQTGSGKQLATNGRTIKMPMVKLYAASDAPIQLPGGVVDTKSVLVSGVANNGAAALDIDETTGETIVKKYKIGTTASDKEFTITSDGKLTLPTDDEVSQYEVVYTRTVQSGVKITNRADKFPGTVHLILKASAIDPCDASTTRGIYIDIPSFQISPDVNIQIGGTDTQQLAYNGNLQVDYCGSEKALYHIYVPDTEGDIEQEG